jgi:hypothetical protein
MDNQEGNELLLPRTERTAWGTAVDEDPKAPEQLDPERGGAAHLKRLHREYSRVPSDYVRCGGRVCDSRSAVDQMLT